MKTNAMLLDKYIFIQLANGHTHKSRRVLSIIEIQLYRGPKDFYMYFRTTCIFKIGRYWVSP